jgi:hypothetical protein
MAHGRSATDEAEDLADWIDEKGCSDGGLSKKTKNRRKKEKRKAKKAQTQAAQAPQTDGSSNGDCLDGEDSVVGAPSALDRDDSASYEGATEPSTCSNGTADDVSVLRQSCFDRNAEQRLLHSLYEQMFVEDEETDDEADEDLIREMEKLRQEQAMASKDRQALRDTLQKRFQKLVDSAAPPDASVSS